jgi:GxxExxY protein
MNEGEGDLTGRVIGAAIRVHEALGPGFLESVYEEALCIELTAQRIGFERQRSVAIRYREKSVGEHRLDLLVEKQLVVELKAIAAFEAAHYAIVRSYLKAVDCTLGLLINFAAPTVQVKRVGREWHSRAS